MILSAMNKVDLNANRGEGLLTWPLFLSSRCIDAWCLLIATEIILSFDARSLIRIIP